MTFGAFGGLVLATSRRAVAADSCQNSEAAGAAMLDKYVAAMNAHDTSAFPDIFTESYIQHSGRSPSGLAAMIDLFKKIFAALPDRQIKVEDRIIAGDKVVARCANTATHSHVFRGVPPTGKRFTIRTIDIWRVENGKFAEHWDLTDASDVLKTLRAG
jgi:steroid delta-isomerase-like uncharacterized protein